MRIFQYKSSAQTGIDMAKESKKDGPGWVRLAPIALLYFSVSTLRQVFSGNYLYALIPSLLVVWRVISERPWLWLPALALLIALLVLAGWLQFIHYRFRLSPGRVEIRSGVIAKKHLDLPHDRIQNVRFVQPLYYRLSDHLCVELDTAGSDGQEARLVALPRGRAEELKRGVLQRTGTETRPGDDDINSSIDGIATAPVIRTAAGEADSHADGNDAAEIELKTRRLSDLVIHGLSSNRIGVILVLLGGLLSQSSSLVRDYLESIGLINAPLDETPWLMVVGFLTASILVAMLVLPLFSVLGAIVSFHGYRLSRAGDRYIRRSGLFTRHEVSMRLRRLQQVELRRNWLNLILGRADLRFEQFDTDASLNAASSPRDSFLVPALRPDEAYALIDDALPDNRLQQASYRPISKFYIFYWCRFWCALFGLTALAFHLSGFPYLTRLLPYIPLALLLSAALSVLRWRRYGYAADRDFLYLRQGLFGLRYRCLPLHKIQQTGISQTFLQRRRGLCDLDLDRAGGNVLALYLSFVPERFGRGLVDWILYRIEAERRPWM